MKKHIAYVCADAGIPVFGTKGASIHVQSVVRAALKAGHRVTLFATRFDGHVPPGLENVACVHLPEIPQGDPTKRAHAALEARDHIAERLDAHAPYDMVYERYSLWSDVGMRWARKHGIPGILEVNAPLIEEQRTHRQLVLEDEARAVAQSAFSQASALLAVSPGVADYLHTWPGTKGRVHVVANLIRQARQQNVQAFFFENNSDPRLLKRMASELKNVTIGELYADSLSPANGPAADYLSMMRYNTRAITQALSKK